MSEILADVGDLPVVIADMPTSNGRRLSAVSVRGHL
jgi:hypothetical protein